MSNKPHTSEIKVKILGSHFAWILPNMWNDLGKKVGLRNRTTWLLKKCEEEFGIYLETNDDVSKLEAILYENYYKDKADWLRDKIREELKGGKSL